MTANTAAKLDILQEMEATSDEATSGAVTFWKPPANVNDSCTVSIHPELVEAVKKFFDDKNIEYVVLADDLQSLIDEEMENILREDEDDGLNYRDPSISYYDVANYNRLNQIKMHLQELQRQYADLMDLTSIGTTAEGRSIQMATISLKVKLTVSLVKSNIFLSLPPHIQVTC